jgi:hypothetical protein
MLAFRKWKVFFGVDRPSNFSTRALKGVMLHLALIVQVLNFNLSGWKA